ncbi:hypothetical protein CRE_01651 [Caenorhabditis remanei]|uniref:Uncharacterized protein n=1 Tax=Caenorhabditis remanei TaxID=31234 RepID=E3LH06_CAERE|nr:hypothetical protein CRE_01651 [Caenorhabditis remanei]
MMSSKVTPLQLLMKPGLIPDFAEIMETSSEINLDDAINNQRRVDTKNEADIFSDLITAIEESLSCDSVNTAVTAETVADSLNAHADPSLNTRISFSTASEISEKEESHDINEPLEDSFYRPSSPLQVWRNNNKITGFEMVCDEKKVAIVDSLECMTRLQQPLEPIYFDPRVYLGVPYSEVFEGIGLSESSSNGDVSTAELGPTSEEFNDWVRAIEEDG